MKNEKFAELILTAYNLASKGNLVGILYNAISTYGFSDIKDIDGLVKRCSPDMLYLKSILTENEIDVYEWELESYTVKESESTIYIKCKNKMEVALMY